MCLLETFLLGLFLPPLVLDCVFGMDGSPRENRIGPSFLGVSSLPFRHASCYVFQMCGGAAVCFCV
jgi:hypothetical protein